MSRWMNVKGGDFLVGLISRWMNVEVDICRVDERRTAVSRVDECLGTPVAPGSKDPVGIPLLPPSFFSNVLCSLHLLPAQLTTCRADSYCKASFSQMYSMLSCREVYISYFNF